MSSDGIFSVNRPINVSIPDKKELLRSYMPFVKSAGIFIPIQNEHEYEIGQKVFIILTLPEEKSKKTISGKVVWLNKFGKLKGIGVSFGEGNNAKLIKDTIETIILDIPNKQDIATFTI